MDRSASQSPDSSKRKAGADLLPVMTDADSNKGGETSEIDMEDSNSGGADPEAGARAKTTSTSEETRKGVPWVEESPSPGPSQPSSGDFRGLQVRQTT